MVMDDKIFTKYDYEKMLNLFNNYVINDVSEKKLMDSLQKQIFNSRPIDEITNKINVVTINSKIVLRNIGNGTREEFQLVLPEDSDVNEKKLSVLSEMGSTIFGNRLGTVVRLSSESEKYFIIEHIRYMKAVAGDMISDLVR